MAKIEQKKQAPATQTPTEAAIRKAGMKTEFVWGQDKPAQPAREKLALPRRIELRLVWLSKRVGAAVAALGKIDGGDAASEAGASLTMAREAIQEARALVAKVPSDAPLKAKKREPKFEIAPGAIVALRDGARATYEGLIDPDDMDQLKVTAVQGKHLAVLTSDGAKLFIPRKHAKAT